ncbi:ATP-binding protein [Cronobacter dublinensis]|uniref:AAA family ATPase n=1 Tax=Cronobacter dublinensis TaxID=413497 RepID=UPI0024AEA517|nr:ATP-binding protein [Cronobacter dublinensis]MDI7398443.1 ATP-binding protein [Cronobacter dublinensis]
MLIEFSVQNYKSISERQTLSLVASKQNELCNNIFSIEEPKTLELLKSAVIYGPNAAGKSNIIKAITTVAEIIVRSAVGGKSGDKLAVTPFKLNSESITQPSEFEINFISEGVRYQYGFSATEDFIHDEWLFAFPKGRPQKWFLRLWNEKKECHEWDLGTSLMGEKQTWMKATRPNALFLSTAVQLNSTQLKPVYDWFYYKVKFTELHGWDHEYSAKQCLKDKKEDILNFLKAADVGIDDIHVTKEKFNISDIPDEMPSAIKDLVIKNMQDRVEYVVKTLHKNEMGESIAFNLEDESHGTRKIFSFAGPLSHSLQTGNVLFIDELNDNLHPKLVEFLVGLFHDPTINKKGAQLIFTTHETSILNQEVFRRDQVWFVEKDNAKRTNLFPLADFSPRKGRENLEASYLDGRYGALPMIGKWEKG